MIWESALHTDSMEDLSYCEICSGTTSSGANNDAIEYLSSLSTAFDNPEANFDGIPGPEVSNVRVWFNIDY